AERDGGCRYPGCANTIVDNHHVQHWADGGETKLSNLVQTCRHHHRLLHEGGYRVELSADGEATFYSPSGAMVLGPKPLPAVGDTPRSVAASPWPGVSSAWRSIDYGYVVGHLAAASKKR